MARARQLRVEIIGDARGLNRSLGQAEGRLKSFGGVAGKLGGILAGAFSVGVVVAGIKSTITAASDLNETMTKTQAVFGKDRARVLEQWANTAAKSLGQSKQQALEATATLGNLFVSMNLGRGPAQKMSTDMVKLASDLASFNNVKPEEALEALRAGLVGETEPLRKFGINLTDAALREEALRLGLVKSTKDVLPAAVKAQASYSLILAQSKTAQGDFARTSDGLANRQRILAAQMTDLKGKIGNGLLPVVIGLAGFLLNKVVPAFQRLAPMARTLGLGIRALGAAFKEGDVTSDGFVGAMERIGVTTRSVLGWLSRNRAIVLSLAASIGAIVVAVKLWQAAVVAYTAVQAALNVVMALNPIGLVVLAVVGLVAAFVVAYKTSATFRKIVQGAWEGIKTAATAVASWFTTTAWPALVTGAKTAGAWAMWLWRNAISPAWTGIKAVVGGTVLAVKAYWDHWLQPVFKAIGATAMWLWRNIIVPAFTAIRVVVGAVFAVIRGYWTTVLQPVLKAIATVVLWLWRNIIQLAMIRIGQIVRVTFFLIRTYWTSVLAPTYRAIGAAAMFLWRNAITPAFNAIRSVISTVFAGIRLVWRTVLSPTFSAVKTGVGLVKGAFDTAVRGISVAWDKLKAATKGPVRFVINTVMNDGLLAGWNWIADKVLGGSFKVGRIPLPRGFAAGGVMPGYTPGRDNQLAAVSGGEAIMRPEWTRAVGPKLVELWNKLARTGGPRAVAEAMANPQFAAGGIQGFAGGGIIDRLKGIASTAWDKVTGVVGGVADFLTNPVGWLTKRFAGPLGRLGEISGTGFGRLVAEFPKRLVGRMLAAAKSLAFGGAGGIGGGSGPGGVGWMMRALRGRFPGLALISGFRPGAITATGNRSYHSMGRAVDVPPRMDVFNWLRGTYGARTRELIFSPAGGRQIHNGRPHMYTGITRANHWDHVHWAYDKGGWLPPGLSMAYNGTGKPERVLGPREVGAVTIERGAVQINVYASPGQSEERVAELVDVRLHASLGSVLGSVRARRAR